ncbi:predicted protein [Naegleria gruberi]|uniref:Predicted protein n=1 Tax=Naegleria gruberi TaxID=5762 RepID=D2VQF9_NAEGR|nr:uncharacterized protein NAEGRDRAFT_71212 [Naegleria gruberi]EFC40939.1 predicted protein [Naegleria gruberi]|eukprot:XP_002673683.1 predicted protein [Naegleria gruberi strain NEG-M]
MNPQDPQILYSAITSLIKFGSFKEALDLTVFLTFSPDGFSFPIYKIFKQLFGKEGCKNYKAIFETLSDCNGENYSHRTILLAMFELEGSCGHTKDIQNAMEILESMNDFSSALSILGYIYYKGLKDSDKSINIDLEKAREYFEQAAYKGNSFGFWFLSEIYGNMMKGMNENSSSTQLPVENPKEKYEWTLSKALEKKNPFALYDQAISLKDSKTLDQLSKLFGLSNKTRHQQVNLLDYLC